jgi:hypothetical protein
MPSLRMFIILLNKLTFSLDLIRFAKATFQKYYQLTKNNHNLLKLVTWYVYL